MNKNGKKINYYIIRFLNAPVHMEKITVTPALLIDILVTLVKITEVIHNLH
jgi:hypothetical protein